MPIADRAMILARRRTVCLSVEVAASCSYVRRDDEPGSHTATLSGTIADQRASKFIDENTTVPLSVAGAEVELGVGVR